MPTLEEARRLAENFERTYPDSLESRLSWWAKVLGLGRTRLLRMMGLSLSEVRRLQDRPLSEVIRRHSDQAWRLEDMLCQLLARYSYDWSALVSDLRRRREAKLPVSRSAIAGQAVAGQRPPEKKAPATRRELLARLAGAKRSTGLTTDRRRKELAFKFSALLREHQLIQKMNKGGPNSLDLLRDLLSSP